VTRVGPALRGAATAGAAVLLAAGLVGLVRQRREAAAVRRGDIAPAHATTDLPPPGGTSALAERFSAWLPERPPAGPLRLLAVLWAAPLTLVGLALGVLGRGRPRWSEEFGCLVFEGVRGPSGRALAAVGAGANALGHVVLSRFEHTPERLLAHEAAHVRQAERLGPLLIPAYLLWQARYGYRHNPVERAARLRARQAFPV
jgi:hypothetical protein